MKKAALFWSGGKDSAFALYKIKKEYPGINIVKLVCTLNENYRRISMHGVREELLDKQADAIGIPLFKMWVPNTPTNASYEERLKETLSGLKSEGIDTIIYGDIFLEDLREYREKMLQEAGLNGLFPLWKSESKTLLKDFIQLGFNTITCCINSSSLDECWLGKEIDHAFIKELPEGVDPCGENGEFHTFCFDGPIYSKPILFTAGRKEFRPLLIKGHDSEEKTGFWYLDLS